METPTVPKNAVVPPDVLPLLSHPTLKRHVRFTHTGELIKARLCHDLFALPYDRSDINKVPFNRVYKREKLLLIDNPGKRKRVLRESLTCDMKLEADDGETVRRGIDRVKRIYAKGRVYHLNSDWDEAKREKCLKIVSTLPRDHPITNNRRLPRITKNGKIDSRVAEDLLQHEEDRLNVHRLDSWEAEKLK